MVHRPGYRDIASAGWPDSVATGLHTDRLASHLKNDEHWRRLKIPPQAVADTFSALVSAVFLNDMYFRSDQDWSHLAGQSDRFASAFRAFNVFALNDYISFLGTVGGSLLPGAWQAISDCVRGLTERTGKSFLTRTSQRHLLRLIGKEASLHRVPTEDRATWGTILYLLDVLADAGIAEAFRLRESVGRFAT